MRSLGFEVETYVEGLGSESILILQSLLGGKINMMTDLENLFEANSDTSFWIQGSSHFVEEQKLELETKQVRNITCIAPSKGRRRDKELERDKRWNHVIISHAAVGGITLGRWACITPSQVPESDLRKPDKVQRSLQHILSHTESGFPHVEVQGGSLKRKRNADQEIVYQGDSRIVPGSSKVVVSTHCVKQPHYPRIKRFLITRELLDVYDIQTRDQDIIGKVPKALISKVIENIASAALEKVVYRIVTQVKEACLQVKTHNVQANSIENEKDTLARTSQSLQWLKYEEDDEILNDEKAARDDDAGIETQQWDRYLIRGYNAKYQTRILTSKFPHISFKIIEPLICKGGLPNEKHDKLLEILRQFSVCTFRRNVTSSYLKYMRDKYGKFDFMEAQSLYKLNKGNTQRLYLIKLFKGKVKYEEFMKDYLAGLEAVHRAANSSFWDWDAGSSLFFWRWPTDFVKEARDGTKVNITGKLPRYKSKQQWPKDENIKEKMMAKWIKIIRRKYVQPGQVVSLTGSFPVAKGENDIRMVYDATKCGLNEQIWAPNFMLPTIDMTLRHVTETGWFGDIDLGEMFLNFPLDSDLRAYVGIDATELRELLKSLDIVPEELLGTKGRIFLRWVRCLMGLRCSPFNAVRAMSWAADIIKGDRFEEFNTFRWDTFCLNLPGSKDYDPKFPLGYKWNQETKSIAADFETYVDDIRSSDGTEEGCVLATRRIASLCNHLGIQDAARKRRFPSKSPGVWCGAKTSADNVGVYTSTTQVKWDKGKTIINGWLQELEESRDFSIEHKPMLSGRGFLVHLARTYPSMVPFLKGVHHTLENWRRGRTADGWKFSTDEWRSFLSEVSEVKSEFKIAMKEYIAGGEADAPARVKGVKRLKGDLISLLTIMKSEKPPQRLVRGLLLAYALYGFGDASGAGFGSSWENNRGTRFRIGVWGKDNVDKSSNYRELCNLVESLEQMAEEERLSGTEVYFFTDNSTAEAAFFKGSSTSKLLHELVTRLRKLEMTRGCKIVLVHVSGERMKWQGSDGLSRGNLLEGVMKGVDMLSYIPLHKTPLERSKELLKWILSWCKDDQEKQEVEVLAPKDWFVKGHDLDGFEIKNGFKHPKFKTGTYIWQPPPAAAEIACEEIRKARCKRTIHGSCEEHRPCWNWVTACKECGEMVKTPKGLFCANFGSKRGSWKICQRGWCSKCYTASENLVFHVNEAKNEAGAIWRREKDKGRFMSARDGDMWAAPFQCDYCWFVNLEGKEAREDDLVDNRLLGYIRRVNLDILWSREPGTISASYSQLSKIMRLCDDLGMSRLELPVGPWPVTDGVGFRLAIIILRASQAKGRNSKEYTQFDTIRRIRSGYSNTYENSYVGNKAVLAFRGEKGKAYKYTDSQTESRLFVKFMRGLEVRMGRLVQSNVGLDHKILQLICRNLEKELADPTVDWERKRTVIMIGSYLMVCFGASLRGNEGFYLERSSLIQMIKDGGSMVEIEEGVGHVCAPLLGRFKGETGEDKHVAVITNVSKSGLQFRLWMERLTWLLVQEGNINIGPAFCKKNGTMLRSYELDWEFHKALKIVQIERVDLIPEDVDVSTLYGTYRSLRRGSLTRATEAGVGQTVLDLINRWSKFEKNRGGKPHMSMREHYLEIKLVLKRLLSYSQAL